MSPMISIASVTKRYKSGLVALDAINLEIAKGEIFVPGSERATARRR